MGTPVETRSKEAAPLLAPPPATLPVPARPVLLRLYRYRLEMRQRFEHATAARENNEGLLVRLQLADGAEGLGEGVPRPYVTGETIASALDIIKSSYARRLAAPDPLVCGPAPGNVEGVWHNAAWCACELAYLDACARSVGEHLAVYLGRRLNRPVATKINLRVSGVVGSQDPDDIRHSMRKMRWFGLRDFKIKVGMSGDAENLRAGVAALRSGLVRTGFRLRADANGAWSLSQALQFCGDAKRYNLAALEQPLPKGDEADLPELRRCCGVPLMVDESLVDYGGAVKLAEAEAVDFWNLRISKNGGLLQTIQLADLARAHGIGLMLGCMVGESGVLSAAARVFLQLVPDVTYLENSYGRFLLREDLVHQRMTFGYGGKIRPLSGPGLGVTMDEDAVAQLAELVAEIKLT